MLPSTPVSDSISNKRRGVPQKISVESLLVRENLEHTEKRMKYPKHMSIPLTRGPPARFTAKLTPLDDGGTGTPFLPVDLGSPSSSGRDLRSPSTEISVSPMTVLDEQRQPLRANVTFPLTQLHLSESGTDGINHKEPLPTTAFHNGQSLNQAGGRSVEPRINGETHLSKQPQGAARWNALPRPDHTASTTSVSSSTSPLNTEQAENRLPPLWPDNPFVFSPSANPSVRTMSGHAGWSRPTAAPVNTAVTSWPPLHGPAHRLLPKAARSGTMSRNDDGGVRKF